MMMMMIQLINTLLVILSIFSGHVQGQKCEGLLDLTLIIDSSGSIAPEDFERAKLALIDLVSRLNVLENKAGVAVINYASTMTVGGIDNVFEFEQIELLKQIAALPHLATNTATGEALALAAQYCNAQCRMLGEGTPRIFAIFTDGHSNEGRPVGLAAQEIRDTLEGTIFAVGVGNIGPDGEAELLEITGDPSYVMNIASYIDLAHVTNAIAMKFCDIPAFVLPDRRIMGEATGNSSRFYRMHTLHKLAKNAFFEIRVTDQVGQVSGIESFHCTLFKIILFIILVSSVYIHN